MSDPPSQPVPLTSEELTTWLTRSRTRQIDGFDSRLAATIDSFTAEKERLEDHRDALIEANEWWEAKCQRIEAEKERLERELERYKSEEPERVERFVLRVRWQGG